MSESQSREHSFESHLLLFRGLGILVLSTMHQFTQLYVATDSVGNASEKSLNCNCRMTECFPEKSSWYRNEPPRE